MALTGRSRGRKTNGLTGKASEEVKCNGQVCSGVIYLHKRMFSCAVSWDVSGCRLHPRRRMKRSITNLQSELSLCRLPERGEAAFRQLAVTGGARSTLACCCFLISGARWRPMGVVRMASCEVTVCLNRFSAPGLRQWQAEAGWFPRVLSQVMLKSSNALFLLVSKPQRLIVKYTWRPFGPHNRSVSTSDSSWRTTTLHVIQHYM